MSYNETRTHKKAKSPIRACSVVQQVHLPSLLRVYIQGNSLSPHPRPLSTDVLAQTTDKLPKHHASASAESRDVNGTGDFTALMSHARQQLHPYGRSASNTSSMSLSGRTAGGHSHKEGKETVAWCIS